MSFKYKNRRGQGMEKQESEARKREIIRQIGRLADDLEELDGEGSDEAPVLRARSTAWVIPGMSIVNRETLCSSPSS
jgi:hypothetical protein